MYKSLYIKWQDSDALGIALIDEQHRGIVSVINTLYYYMQKGEGKEELLHILDMLEFYLKVHFEVEENMLMEAGYKEYKKHKDEHKVFFTKLQYTKSVITNINEPLELLKSLKEWWLNHIKIEDAKYAPLIKEKF